MGKAAPGQPPWAGRVARWQIEKLYRTEAQGIVDEELIDRVGYDLLARCESMLAVARGHSGTPACPGCLKTMDRAGEVVRCAQCDWSTTVAAFRHSYQKKHLHAGRMEPFLEAYAEDFVRARDARQKMLLIDILIHRCHGDYEQTEGRRPGAINLIGGKPREVVEFLDRLGGIRRSGLTAEANHDAWVDRTRGERSAGWRAHRHDEPAEPPRPRAGRYRVRPATEEDLPALTAIKPPVALHRDRLRDVGGGGLLYLVVEKRGTVYGFGLLAFAWPEAWPENEGAARLPTMIDLVVRPDRRGRGAGSWLIARMEEIARSRGCERVYLGVDPVENARVQRLYERLGYVPLQTEPYRSHWKFTDSDGQVHEGDDWTIDLVKELGATGPWKRQIERG